MKNVIVGTGIFLFGVFIAWLVLSGADPDMKYLPIGGLIVIWVLAGLCLFLGGYMMVKVISDWMKLRKGDHPILNAIRTSDTSYLVWVYENITSVQGGGSDHQIWTFSKTGSKIILSVKKKRVRAIMNYLKQEFPNVTLGWTSEIEQEMSERFEKAKKTSE